MPAEAGAACYAARSSGLGLREIETGGRDVINVVGLHADSVMTSRSGAIDACSIHTCCIDLNPRIGYFITPLLALIVESMDRLRLMEAFVATVEEGSMTKAAEKLRVSLPVVVRSLGALERRLGVRLLNRTTRRSHLTEPGEAYFARCKSLLAEFADAERSIAAQGNRPVGTIRVSAPVLFGGLHIAPAVAGFLKRYAEVSVDLTLTDRVVDLVEDGMDVAVRIGALPDSALIAAPLGTTQRVICASPGYLKQAGEPKVPADLRGHAFLRFTALVGAREIVLQDAGKALRVPVRGNFASNNGTAVIAAALQGAGLACVLYYQVLQHVKAKELKLVLQRYAPAPIPIHAVYLEPRLASAKVRVFVDFLRTLFANTSFAPSPR